MLEKRQEHLAEKILMESVHFKILISGGLWLFKWEETSKSVFLSLCYSVAVVQLHHILTYRWHGEFLQDKVSVANNLLFVLFITPQAKLPHHLICLKNNPVSFCKYQPSYLWKS